MEKYKKQINQRSSQNITSSQHRKRITSEEGDNRDSKTCSLFQHQRKRSDHQVKITAPSQSINTDRQTNQSPDRDIKPLVCCLHKCLQENHHAHNDEIMKVKLQIELALEPQTEIP